MALEIAGCVMWSQSGNAQVARLLLISAAPTLQLQTNFLKNQNSQPRGRIRRIQALFPVVLVEMMAQTSASGPH